MEPKSFPNSVFAWAEFPDWMACNLDAKEPSWAAPLSAGYCISVTTMMEPAVTLVMVQVALCVLTSSLLHQSVRKAGVKSAGVAKLRRITKEKAIGAKGAVVGGKPGAMAGALYGDPTATTKCPLSEITIAL